MNKTRAIRCWLLSARLIFTYFRHNRDLNRALASNASIDRNGFLKLLALGVFDVIITMPLAVIQLVTDLLIVGNISFWPGWKAVHSSYSTIPQLTTQEWKSAGFWTVFIIKFNQWIFPAYAIVFFLLFGTTKQKRSWYRNIFWKAMRPFGLKPRVDPVTSDVVFGSGPGVNSATNDTRGTVMWVFLSLLWLAFDTYFFFFWAARTNQR